MRHRVLAALFLASSLPAQVLHPGEDPAGKKAVLAACAGTDATPLPPDIQASAAPAQAPSCDSYALYDKHDFAAARACAIQERAAILAGVKGTPGNESDTPIGGMIVLTQLYANGEAVPRNPALAARFYCEALRTGEGEISEDPDAGSDDTRQQIAFIQHLQQRQPTDPPLIFCNNSNAPEGVPTTRYCEQQWEEEHARMHAGGIQEGIDSAQKDADDADAAIAPLLKQLTATQKVAYDKTAAAMQHFIDVQVTGDYLYMGGYGSGGLYPNEEHAAFENQVIDFLKQPPAPPDPAATKAADDALNQFYNRLMSAAAPLADMPRDSKPSYAITPEGLRREQRAWLAYRDAFINFGRTLNPGLPASAWQLPLTRARAEDLKNFYDGNASSYTQAIQSYNDRIARASSSAFARTSNERARVANILDNLTPPQQTAWAKVQSALHAYTAAHNAAVPHATPVFEDQQLQKLYGELYAIQYNQQHGFQPDHAKAAEGFSRNDANLNAEYQADLASTCLFQPVPGEPPTIHRTPEGLRNEQRAWITLRDAWVDFLGLIYPNLTREERANMTTGSRAFELRMLHEFCDRTHQPPREQ